MAGWLDALTNMKNQVLFGDTAENKDSEDEKQQKMADFSLGEIQNQHDEKEGFETAAPDTTKVSKSDAPK